MLKSIRSYKIERAAIIRNWKIGLFYRLFQFIIISYVVGYIFEIITRTDQTRIY
jgi:hypothetical protein